MPQPAAAQMDSMKVQVEHVKIVITTALLALEPPTLASLVPEID
jgi:hypothetical protein